MYACQYTPTYCLFYKVNWIICVVRNVSKIGLEEEDKIVLRFVPLGRAPHQDKQVERSLLLYKILFFVLAFHLSAIHVLVDQGRDLHVKEFNICVLKLEEIASKKISHSI